ncbi:head-tail connector protein [Streptococcus suis]|nr:head-tail connector protein [Streptococcus suis]
MIMLDEAKLYLKVENVEEDELIEQLIAASQKLCEDILRETSTSEVLKTAVLYGVAYLYEHREEANHKELKETLYHLLLADRKDVF